MLPQHMEKFHLNVRKAQGTLMTIERMLQDQRGAIELAQQVNAVIGLLQKANTTLLEGHLHSCAKEKLHSDDKEVKNEFIQELIQMFEVSMRK